MEPLYFFLGNYLKEKMCVNKAALIQKLKDKGHNSFFFLIIDAQLWLGVSKNLDHRMEVRYRGYSGHLANISFHMPTMPILSQ